MSLGLEERASLGWIGLLRAISGGILLGAGLQKLSPSFDGPALLVQLGEWSSAGLTFPFAAELLSRHVAPRADLFAPLVVVGEIAAGLSLLLGLGARVGALAGLVMSAAYFLASREDINLLLAAVHLAVLVTGGGRALGVDGPLRQRFRFWFIG